jgi:uncharacterized protein (DUF427 family)
MTPQPDAPAPGQESASRYPRPPMAEQSFQHIHIQHVGVGVGVVVADTGAAVRTFETSHPPSWYIPTDAIAPGLLGPSQRQSFCEWEGGARYWHLDVRG